jgi:hypothetical protein
VWNGWTVTICEMAEEVGISYSLCKAILIEDLGMRHFHLSLFHNCSHRNRKKLLDCGLWLASKCRQWWKLLNKYHETQAYRYDANTKQQSSQWKSSLPWLKTAHQVLSKIKVKLTAFFNYEDFCTKSMLHKIRISTSILIYSVEMSPWGSAL